MKAEDVWANLWATAASGFTWCTHSETTALQA